MHEGNKCLGFITTLIVVIKVVSNRLIQGFLRLAEAGARCYDLHFSQLEEALYSLMKHESSPE